MGAFYPDGQGQGQIPRLRVEELVVRDVGPLNLAVARGECIAISGPSGAGKTLLLRALADLDPHEGRVYLDGVECNTFSGSQWRRRVAYLPAESRWWRETVGEHFPVGHEGLQELGFSETILQRPVSYLSSGEKQRLALLRLLANQPRVLLLDEPSAALDADNTRRLEALVSRCRQTQQAAVLWVSHDAAQIARVAAHHLRLRDGRLEAVV